MKTSLKKRPLSKIHKAQADETLGSVLEKSHSSHDPIFIYEGEEFSGLTSPYYAVFKKRYPRNTKVIHASFMPPHISSKTSIYKVAEHMLSTKTYTLPTTSNSKVDGIVEANDILKEVLKSNVLEKTTVKVSRPITILSSKMVKDAHAQMKKRKVSRLIVINDKGQLEGIVSRRDLQTAFTTPNRKLRFGKSKSVYRSWSFDDEKIKSGDYPLHEFYRTNVATTDEDTSAKEALKKMLDKNVGSIIFINSNNEPTGLVSTHTYLQALSNVTPTQIAKTILTDKHNTLSDRDRQTIETSLQKLAKKIEKQTHITQISATIDTEKNSAGRTKLFQISLSLDLDKDKNLYTKTTGKNLKQTLQTALKKISHQIPHHH